MINKRIWLTGAAIIAVVFLFFFVQKRFFLQDDGMQSGAAAEKSVQEPGGTSAGAADAEAAGVTDSAAAKAGEEAAGSRGAAAERTAVRILPAEAAGSAAGAASEGSGGTDGGRSNSSSSSRSAPGLRKIKVETDKIAATFSSRGGIMESLILKGFREPDGRPVEMVLAESSKEYPFTFRFNDYPSEPVKDLFYAEKNRRGEETIVEFSRDYVAVEKDKPGAAEVPFTILRRYTFKDSDYLFKYETIIKSAEEAEGIEDFSYAVEIGPQIGPDYQELNNRTEYRYFTYLSENGRRTAYRTSGPGVREVEGLAGWCGIEGKYFVFLAVPDAEIFRCIFDSETRPGIRRRSAFHLARLPVSSFSAGEGEIRDTVYFYAGPKKKELLLRYNSADTNGFAVSSLALDKVLPEPKLIGRIAGVLRQILRLFYRLLPNYGIAIILLAVIIRGGLFPLAIRQERQKDKIEKFNLRAEEIRKKYPDDQGRANEEIQELYRQERIRPVGRTWPLLVQLPILVALYYLLNNHFDLRGAGFLRGWIDDLSVADKAVDFFPRRLPLVKWTSLNLLPVLLFIVLLVQARVVERPESNSRMQTISSFLFPLVVLLIMYNLPAGVVLYFFIYSVLGIIQFYLIKRFRPRIIGRM